MAFRPAVEQEILIDEVVYRFVEHPAAQGMPYGQEGRAATVYKLHSEMHTRGHSRFSNRHIALHTCRAR